MKLFVTTILFMLLLWSNSSEPSAFDEENLTQERNVTKPRIPLVDAIHNIIAFDAKYALNFYDQERNFFIEDEDTSRNAQNTIHNTHAYNYASFQARLFRIFSFEKSAYEHDARNLNGTFDFYNLNLVVYNQDRYVFGNAKHRIDKRFDGIFYGIYGWETSKETFKHSGFEREANANSLELTKQSQGLFLSKVWDNMINMLGILSHSTDGKAISKEIDKMPITFLSLTFVPKVSFDLYTANMTFDYLEDGASIQKEHATGSGWNFELGFYLFSYDLFRTHALNVSLFTHASFIYGQELYTFSDGSLKDQNYYNILYNYNAQGYLSVSF